MMTSQFKSQEAYWSGNVPDTRKKNSYFQMKMSTWPE